MTKKFALLLALLPLASAHAQFTLPARPGAPAAYAPADDASWRCAQAHIGQGQPARRPSTTVAHSAKMNRYDVKYYKLDLALENNSRDVAGSVLIRVRVGSQPLDSLAFELFPLLPNGEGMIIDRMEINGLVSPGIRRAGSDATARLAQPAAAGSLLDARIFYHGTAPHGSSAAIGNALDTDYVGTYATDVTWSLSEPFSAHEWFPCKQILTDKADSSDVWVTTTLPRSVRSCNAPTPRTT